MYPILEVSTSLQFEPSHTSTTQEIDSKVESSPFLKLLEEVQTSPKEEQLETKETSTHEEVEEKLESSPKEEIEENAEPKIITFIPTNWEVSELTQTAELSDTEIIEEELQISSPEESLELLSQENVLQTEEVQQVEAELEFQNFEFVSKQETQVQDFKEIPLSQEVTERTSVTSQTENLTLKENLLLEETAKIFNEDSLEKELVPQASLQPLQTEVQPVLKIKSEVTKPASSEESKQSEINSESKETKLSSDLLSLFKNKLSPKEENSTFNEPIETKQVSLSPNVKLLQKEELPQTKEVNFTQSTEKENSSITWSVQNFRNPNTKDVNNKTTV
ncbi:MAG: hypothetical protein N3A69_06405, partial [Leptospiraceae bacterium]|nr:hypothetical protein [Leptospiraceae bacterium]